MSRKPNKNKAEYLKHLADKADILKESAKNIVFNFKFFCYGRTGGKVSKNGSVSRYWQT